MHGGLLYKLFFLNTLSSAFNSLANNDTPAAGLIKFLGNIWSPAVVYKAEYEDYFIGEGMGVTTVGQHKVEISDSKPTSKTLYNKVIIVRIEEVEFCTDFVGGVLGNNICGLMKGDNESCNKYKTHAYIDRGNVDSTLYLTTHVTNLFLKPLVSLVIEDANQEFLSQLGEDLSKC